jgi:hypothetical protein
MRTCLVDEVAKGRGDFALELVAGKATTIFDGSDAHLPLPLVRTRLRGRDSPPERRLYARIVA